MNLKINLQDIQIESYDNVQGRPSIVDIHNNQVYEGSPNDDDNFPLEFSDSLGTNTNKNEINSGKLKFKKVSQIDKNTLNSILDSKARISINTKTGKREFIYQNFDGAQKESYYENSIVNCIDTSEKKYAQIRPSKLLWQLPFEQR